jgi:hypothetical protein
VALATLLPATAHAPRPTPVPACTEARAHTRTRTHTRARARAPTWLADEHGVVLRAPRQDLDAAPDLVVAPDHGVQLAVARGGREVARVL